MKRIVIIGTGVGSMTGEAERAVAEAGLLLGAPRMLAAFPNSPQRPVYLPADVLKAVEESPAESIAVLVSGDVGFYSAATGLKEALSGYELSFVPGVSSVGAFFARLKLPWQDAAFVSLHGRKAKLLDAVRRNRFTFCLGGGAVDLPLNVKAYVGENLGQTTERVYECTSAELNGRELPSLSVLLFENDNYDASSPVGLTDGRFRRLKDVPMTKSETRALVMSKLCLKPEYTCWDIGAGTGSVTVEMALSAYRGHVYSVERRSDAIPLIKQNCADFYIGNVSAICGEAPEALLDLPAPDAVFIGGSSGALEGIVRAALSKNPLARIVITAITPETTVRALGCLDNPEIVQLNVSRGKTAGDAHLMLAQNPVAVISAGGLI